MMWPIHWKSWQSFFGISEPINFWSILNSPFLTTVIIGAIALWFQRRNEVIRLLAITQQKTDERRRAVDQDSEAIAAQVVTDAQQDHRDATRLKVQQLKKLIDQRIQADPDGRHHRVYRSLSKHDYLLRAEALFERGRLVESQMDAIAAALSVWSQYAVGRASKKMVPEEVKSVVQKAIDALEG